MVKTVTIGENVQKCIEDTVSKRETVVGLVMGQGGDQGDHVVHLARTPLESEGTKEEKESVKDDSKPRTIEDWEVDLVVQHARQVTRMLLGGFDVLGLFVCTTSSTLSTRAVAVCKQMLTEIHKMHSKLTIQSNLIGSERILLHISCAPYKVSCMTVDVTSALSIPKPTEYKVAFTRWQCLQCHLAINLTIQLANKHTNSSLIKQIRTGLEPLCTSIDEAVYLINGQLRNPDGVFELQSGQKDKKGKRQKNQLEKLPPLNVDFLINSNSNTLESNLLEQDCNITMQVRGTVQGRTYVPSNTAIEDGVRYLRLDIFRSLIGRCEIHCEDLLVIDEEQLDRVVVHELPCRVFAPLPDCEVTVSDYLFPGEKAKDSLDALSELLDLSLLADDIELCYERLPETSDLTPSPAEEREICTGVPVAEMFPPKPLTSCNYMIIGFSVTVAIVAGGTSFYLLQQ